MKQTVVEYYTQDGSVELAIRTHLKANPNQVVKFMGMTQHNYQGHYSQEVYGVKLQVKVFELDNEENIVNELTHKRIKGTYIAEKLEQFIRNTINGQDTFYWDWDKSLDEVKEDV